MTSRLLVDLWRIAFGVDAHGSFAGVERFGLWELPTGLYFFDPPREGNHEFYSDLFARLKRRRFFSVECVRPQYLMAAEYIPPGARLLDVGCGLGNFRACVPQADYTGLDPHMAADALIAGVRTETLGQHLLGHVGSYDAVCCFEVIEHVPSVPVRRTRSPHRPGSEFAQKSLEAPRLSDRLWPGSPKSLHEFPCSVSLFAGTRPRPAMIGGARRRGVELFRCLRRSVFIARPARDGRRKHRAGAHVSVRSHISLGVRPGFPI